MFHPLFDHNTKYCLLKLWKIVKNMKMDVIRLFFLENKKKLNFCFTDLICFLYFLKKEKF